MAVPIRMPYFRLVQGAISPSLSASPSSPTFLIYVPFLPLLSHFYFYPPHSLSSPFARSMREKSMHTICFCHARHNHVPGENLHQWQIPTNYHVYVHWLFLASRDAYLYLLSSFSIRSPKTSQTYSILWHFICFHDFFLLMLILSQMWDAARNLKLISMFWSWERWLERFHDPWYQFLRRDFFLYLCLFSKGIILELTISFLRLFSLKDALKMVYLISINNWLT